MWCANCQADVAAEVTADHRQVRCATCGTTLDTPLTARATARTREARELLERWSSGALFDPFGPLPSLKSSALANTDSPARNSPSPEADAATPANTPAATPEAGVPEAAIPAAEAAGPASGRRTFRVDDPHSQTPEAERTREEPVRAAAKTVIRPRPTSLRANALLEEARARRPESTAEQPPSTTPAGNSPSEVVPPLSEVLAGAKAADNPEPPSPTMEVPAPRSRRHVRIDAPEEKLREEVRAPRYRAAPRASREANDQTSHERDESHVEARGPARDGARSSSRDYRVDLAHETIPAPHRSASEFAPEPVRPRSRGAALAGQGLAYAGVLGLTIGTAMVVWGYFGGPEHFTPTGWLITTGGQMLLFLGVVTLVSSGMEQTTDEVARRVESLGERLLRIEQASRDHALKGPSIPAERFAAQYHPEKSERRSRKKVG